MITLRPAAARGHANLGWLDSHHSFSFGDYHDPKHMGFRALRVINEDRVAGGGGFPPHSHRDMEIISYVLDGELGHKDSTGTGATLRPGEVQRMSAGTGIQHSEMNASKLAEVHFLQIWLLPTKPGIAPGYEQKAFPEAGRRGRLRLVASPDGDNGSVTIHSDVRLYVGLFAGAEKASLELAPGRHAWVQIARGELTVNGERMVAGDGAALSNEAAVEVGQGSYAEVLIFDLP